MKLKRLNITRFYRLSLIYTFTLLLIVGIGNYYTWIDGIVTSINLLFVLGWLALYFPLFISYKYDHWEIKEFGFIVNYKTVLFLIVFLILLFSNNGIPLTINWKSLFLETFSRTGEELFFRGFLYVLFLKIFNNQNKPWIWAVVLSSLLFSMVHTQTLLPEYNSTMFDIFTIGIVLALLRKWSGSILPCILIHILIKSFNILGCILGIIFYFMFVLVAHFKKEKVFQF